MYQWRDAGGVVHRDLLVTEKPTRPFRCRPFAVYTPHAHARGHEAAGPDRPGDTDAFGIGGTDLGAATTAPDGRIVAVFGDTFESRGRWPGLALAGGALRRPGLGARPGCVDRHRRGRHGTTPIRSSATGTTRGSAAARRADRRHQDHHRAAHRPAHRRRHDVPARHGLPGPRQRALDGDPPLPRQRRELGVDGTVLAGRAPRRDVPDADLGARSRRLRLRAVHGVPAGQGPAAAPRARRPPARCRRLGGLGRSRTAPGRWGNPPTPVLPGAFGELSPAPGRRTVVARRVRRRELPHRPHPDARWPDDRPHHAPSASRSSRAAGGTTRTTSCGRVAQPYGGYILPGSTPRGDAPRRQPVEHERELALPGDALPRPYRPSDGDTLTRTPPARTRRCCRGTSRRRSRSCRHR